MARTRGWAPIGERTRRVATQHSTHKYNVIPAISTLGVVAHMIQEETVTREDFEFYLENILVSVNIFLIKVVLLNSSFALFRFLV